LETDFRIIPDAINVLEVNGRDSRLLTEAEIAFAPPQPKKTAVKQAKAPRAVKAAQKTAAKKTTAKKEVAA
jgi:hypothetical protein